MSNDSLIRTSKGKKRLLWGTVSVLSLGYLAQLFWYSWTFYIPRAKIGFVFIAFMGSIYYINETMDLLENIDSKGKSIEYPQTWKKWRFIFTFGQRYPYSVIAFYFVMALCAIIPSLFIYYNYETLLFTRVGSNTDLEVFVGSLVLLPITHATFKEFGQALGWTLIVALLYARLGPYLPSMLAHGGYSWRSILRITTIALQDGAWGSVTQIIATWVAIFVIWAGLIQGFDGLDWIRNAGKKLGNRVSTGPVLTAIVSSVGFGMVSGSGAANTAITGSFTIPLMKESTGIRAKYAAAVEAVASTGGQITPPIMGASIFLMADILGVRLSTLIILAAVPAILFYIPLVYSSHMMTVKHRSVESTENLDAPTLKGLASSGFHIYIPMGILLYLLLIEEESVMLAGVYTIISMLLTSVVYEISDYSSDNPDSSRGAVMSYLHKFDKGLHDGFATTARLAMLGGAIGIIMRIIIITGVAQELAFWMVSVAGASIFLLLVMVAGLAIIIGMGSPPIAAYLLTVLILAPSVVDLGVPRIQAHFFVFYFAVVSYFTPPVAISCAIASRIADTSFLSTTFEAMKLGLPLFVLPFTFYYYTLIPQSLNILSSLPNALYVLICLLGLSYTLWTDDSNLRRVTVGLLSVCLLVIGPVFIGFI